jgi:hypothetical protein
MRQIELHRHDPSVSLKPPPHPVWVFLRKYGFYGFISFAAGYGSFLLIRGAYGPDPPTRFSVLDIATGVFNLTLACQWLVFTWIFDWRDKLMEEDLRLYEMISALKMVSGVSREGDSPNVTAKLPPSKDK